MNYYDYLEVSQDASTNEINSAYENKIIKYNNLKSLTDIQITEIKNLKKALYILTNDRLREKYNKKIISPLPENDNELVSFDRLFNVDNSWMKKDNNNINKDNKKESTVLENRIFSLSEFNKKSYSTDSEIFLRKQQCGREEKN